MRQIADCRFNGNGRCRHSPIVYPRKLCINVCNQFEERIAGPSRMPDAVRCKRCKLWRKESKTIGGKPSILSGVCTITNVDTSGDDGCYIKPESHTGVQG